MEKIDIFKSLPSDNAKQADADDILKETFDKYITLKQVDKLCDLGCGSGRKADFLNSFCKEYIGVDIDSSKESISRKRNDFKFLSFDGSKLPFSDNEIDIIYMNQVLEHVRDPFSLLKDINRALKEKCFIVGSVSYLEPFHSESIFNWTPFGLVTIFKKFNFETLILRPNIDSFTIINRAVKRSILNENPILEDLFWNRECPFYYLLNEYFKVYKKSWTIKQQNYFKLLISGQFSFCAQKVTI